MTFGGEGAMTHSKETATVNFWDTPKPTPPSQHTKNIPRLSVNEQRRQCRILCLPVLQC